MAKKRKVSVEIDLTANSLKKEVNESNKDLTTMRKELKLNSAELKGNGENVELLANREETLKKGLEASGDKVTALKSRLELLKAEYGEESDVVRKANNQLIDAQTEYQKIQNELDDTSTRLKDLTNNARDSGEGMEKSAKGGFTVFKGVLKDLISNVISKASDGIKNLWNDMKESAQAGDEIDKMSQKLGLSYEGYQKWSFVLSQSGLEINNLQAGMKSMTNQIDKAINNVPESTALFEKLNISVSDLKNSTREEIFEKIISSMQSMEDGVDRAALANKLFGRSGQELTPLLNETAQATEELKEKALETGMVMSDDAVNASVEYTDAMDVLNTSLETTKDSLIAGCLPAITDIITAVTDELDFDAIGEKIDTVGEKVDSGIDNMKEAYDWLQKHKALIEAVAVVIGVLTVAIGAYMAVQKAEAVIKAMKISLELAEETTLWGVVAAQTAAIGPYLLVVAAIAAVIAIIVLVIKHFDDIKRVAGNVAGYISDKFTKMKDGIINAFKSIPDTIHNLFDKIKAKIKTPKIEVTYNKEGTLATVAKALGLEGFPKLSIHWNKDGALFTHKTIRMEGFAEAGDNEYALPLNQRTLQPLAEGIVANMMFESQNNTLLMIYNELKNGNLSLESKIVDAIVNKVIFKISDRELGRVVKKL